jgi:molybdopterin molybdotransferase
MEYLSVVNAQKCILEFVNKLDIETVRLEQSLGRVLAEVVRANRDQPPYDVSAMDGYALRSVDLTNVPAIIEIIEDIKAGDMPGKTVLTGQCARIMTGAPVSQGADAVVRVEDTLSLSDSSVQINRTAKPGNDIRRLGENMRNGDVVLTASTEITPGVIGILATVKCAQLLVYRRPSVAILSTGNELEGMEDPVDPNKIPNSNSYALMAQVQALGIEPILLGIARDDPDELAEYLQRGLKFDVLLVSGGSSVGVHDFVRPTIEALGVKMHFWRVAIRPGHPLAFGTTDKTAVFGLPGNPVSSMVCFEEFVIPALRHMMGHQRIYRRTLQARLAHPVVKRPGRTDFIRVVLSRDDDGNYVATSTGTQSSGVSLSMAKADGLLVVPADSKGFEVNQLVTVQLLDGTEFQDVAGFRE